MIFYNLISSYPFRIEILENREKSKKLIKLKLNFKIICILYFNSLKYIIMSLYILCLLVIGILVNAEMIYRLSTTQKYTLDSKDYIYSTLGLFRMKLVSPSCQIKI